MCLAEPDALVLATLGVQEQRDERNVEDEADGGATEDAPCDVIVDSDGRSEREGREGAAGTEDVEHERREACRNGQSPAKPPIIGHQQSTKCIERDHAECDEDAESEASNDVALDA